MKKNAAHPLSLWLKERMSQSEFARCLDISEGHLSLVLRGKKGLSLDLALKIERETGGSVTAAALFDAAPKRLEAVQ